MNAKIAMLTSAGIIVLGALAAPVGAGAMPVVSLEHAAPADVVQVRHRGRPHRRARITVHPRYHDDGPYYQDENYVPDYGYFYPPARGFGDRSNVQRGNIRGCSVDLGYGRYESCDQ